MIMILFSVWAGIKNEKFKVKELKNQKSKQFDCFDYMIKLLQNQKT